MPFPNLASTFSMTMDHVSRAELNHALGDMTKVNIMVDLLRKHDETCDCGSEDHREQLKGCRLWVEVVRNTLYGG